MLWLVLDDNPTDAATSDNISALKFLYQDYHLIKKQLQNIVFLLSNYYFVVVVIKNYKKSLKDDFAWDFVCHIKNFIPIKQLKLLK